MKRTLIYALALTATSALFHSVASAQETHIHEPTLHILNRWKECSFQLDPALTQAAWRQFTQEAGLVTYFRPLMDARPMGKGTVEVAILQWQTGIDDSDPAWNDTFVHPDGDHWLFEGSRLAFPGLTVRTGVTDRIDVGAYATKAVGANYGFYGGQLQYNVANDVQKNWAASTRVSFVSMYGPEDVDFSVYGVDLLASRTYAVAGRVSVSPYVGASTYLSSSHEKTTAVNLSDEQVLGVQGMVGAALQISKARLGVEYNLGRVTSTSMKVGVSF